MNIQVGDIVFQVWPGKGPGPLAKVLMIDGNCAFLKFKQDDPSAINTHDTALLGSLHVYMRDSQPRSAAIDDRQPPRAYKILSVDGPEEAPAVTFESVEPITPNDSRHDHITTTVTPAVAERARELQGHAVYLGLDKGDRKVVNLFRAGPSCAPYDPLSPDYGLNEVVR